MRKTATKDGLSRNAKLPEILFNDERLKYLDAVKSFEDLIFARLGMYSGLRLNEALNITPNDIVFPERAVSVIGKGNKQRYVPVDHAS